MDEVRFTGYYDKGENYGVQLRCTSVPDILTNSSKLKMEVYLIHPRMNISSRTGSTTVDGVTGSFKTAAYNSSAATRLVTTVESVIQHNPDGTREVDVAASFPFDLSNNTYGRIRTAKVSGTLTLDTIPRSSSIATQSAKVEAGRRWSVTVSKNVDAFRHKATLTFGEQTMTTEVFDTSTSALIPMEWLYQMTDKAEGNVEVSIQTYADETCEAEIGAPVLSTFTLAAPMSAGPVLSDGWVTLAPYNVGTPAEELGVYVRMYSKAKATFDASKVSGQYGAEITSFQIEYGGTVTDDLTIVLVKDGEQPVRCIATDSRGLQRATIVKIMVHQYFPPALTGISVYRCNAAGEADDEGTFLYFKATCSFSDCGGANTATVNASYKPVTQSIWPNSTALESGVESILGAGSLSPAASYNARIIARDRLGKQASFVTLISTAAVAFNLKPGGNGGSFGGYAEEDDMLNCDWRFRAKGIEGVSIYKAAETKAGLWLNGEQLYRRVFADMPVTANSETFVGFVSGNEHAVELRGVIEYNGEYKTISNAYTSGGTVYVVSDVDGKATVIMTYYKT